MKKTLFLLLTFCCFLTNITFSQSVLLTPDKIDLRGGFNSNIFLTNVGNLGYPSVIGTKHSGTSSAPLQTLSGSTLLELAGSGRTTFGLTSPLVGIKMIANQNFTSPATGTYISFYTTENGTSLISPPERMKIDHNGYVGIGLNSPDQILDVNGRMRIRHTVIGGFPYTSGVWMSNSTNSVNGADGAFYGMINDTQAGIYIGNAWRFAVNSNGNIVNTGFTQLGNSVPAGASPGATAPAIKTLKLTGTTAGAAGASISVDHGLGNRLKILGYTVLVVGTSAVSYPPEYTYNGGYQYSTTCSNTQILIINSHLNSANIYNKAFTVLITYEE